MGSVMWLAEKERKKRWIGAILVVALCLFSFSTPFQQFASFPEEIRLFTGAAKQLHLSMPVTAKVTSTQPNVIQINGNNAESEVEVNLSKPFAVSSHQVGETELSLKLFGLVPIKKVKVGVYPDLKVIPGGQSIGVKLKSNGILVVGHYLIQQGDKRISPGGDAEIQVGDTILQIDGKKVKDVYEVSDWVQEAGKAGKALTFTIKRDREKKKVQLKPVLDPKEQAYKIGLYIRDSAAGVGTLTFYAPNEKVYGALGHVIADMDTQKPIIVGGGQIVPSRVTSINKGQNGAPGEKIAKMLSSKHNMGTIEKNTPFGIFGKMPEAPDHSMFNKPIPIAFSEEIKEGSAEILTVVDGQDIERYDIEIVKVVPQKYPAAKGMILKITDPELLEKTGGIVQGMSGSPIIQGGKLVGAVSHVFVNDPTSGYGVFIEWMLRDAGIDLEKYKKESQSSNLQAS
jgi:stage IV sporulation protein B